MSKLIKQSLLVAAGIAASTALVTSTAHARSGIEGSLGIVNVNPDSDANFSEKAGGRATLGYRFDNPFSVEVQGLYAEPDILTFDDNVYYETGYLAGLYHFQVNEEVEPFVSLGYGVRNVHSFFGETGSMSGALGFGLKYYPLGNLIIRPEFQISRAAEFSGEDYLGSLSLGYIFAGPGEPKPAPAPKPVVSQAPADTDGDGVIDSADACPGTPAGVTVDDRGCEVKVAPVDTDGDGVFDPADECPNTRAGLVVDSKGCPKKLTEKVKIDLNINFATNSDVVLSQYFNEIRRVADFMNQYKGTVVKIEGHTDTRGSAAYNKNLSQKRATAVARILTNQMGIDSSRVTAQGYGEERPIADESTKAGLLANRRVEAHIETDIERFETK